jgi:urease accessory protein
VRSWLEHAIAPGEGVIVAHAAGRAAEGDWPGLADLNDLMTASRPVPTIRRASYQQGEALVDLAATWPWSAAPALALRALDRGPWHHAVAFGAIAHAAGADVAEVVALYLQNAAVGAVGAAVRGVPIGHTHGQQVLAYLQPSVAEFSAVAAKAPLESYGGLSPSYEVMCHAQYHLYSRMFQS